MKTEQLQQLNRLPEQLRQQGQFCLWKMEERDGRPTKVPKNPNNPQYNASVDNPRTFSDFETAVRVATSTSNISGIGTRVSATLTGVDIDHCFDDEGNMSDFARDIIETLDAYTEKSPSGTGVHIYFTAPTVDFSKDKYYIKHGDLEVYIDGATNRYLTVTGNVIRNEGQKQLVDRSEELKTVLNKYMLRENPKTEVQALKPISSGTGLEDDITIHVRAMHGKNGQLYMDLFNGNWQPYYSSQSEADLGFCNLLAFWFGRDPVRMDNIFRSSGLYREKWEREDYRNETLTKAIASTTETYKPSRKLKDGEILTLMHDGYSKITEFEAATIPTEDDYMIIENHEVDTVKTSDGLQQSGSKYNGVDSLNDFLSDIKTNRFEAIPTGIDPIDKTLGGGFMKRTLVTLGAAPGMGKTAMAQYIMENIARNGRDVIYINLEMDKAQLYARSLARVSWNNRTQQNKYTELTTLEILRAYEVNDQKKKALEDAADIYRKEIAPHFIYNPGNVDNKLKSILDACNNYTKVLKSKGRTEAPIVCVDYLQLIEDNIIGTNGRAPEGVDGLKDTIIKLKQYAIDNDTVVLLIIAHNRASNMEGSVTMASGRDTSAIEYTGDVMLGLNYTAVEDGENYVDGYYKSKGSEHEAGDPILRPINIEFIEYKIKEAKRNKQPRPNIANRLCLKILKSRFSEPLEMARFYFDGKHSYFKEDNT